MRRLLTTTLLLTLGGCAMHTGGAAAPPSYVVFFTERSSALDPAAVEVIAQVASVAKAEPGAAVLVRGWTDSVGSKQDDVILSRDRATRVADALAADGVAVSRISRQGRGQTGNDPGVESRRVEIVLSH